MIFGIKKYKIFLIIIVKRKRNSYKIKKGQKQAKILGFNKYLLHHHTTQPLRKSTYENYL